MFQIPLLMARHKLSGAHLGLIYTLDWFIFVSHPASILFFLILLGFLAFAATDFLSSWRLNIPTVKKKLWRFFGLGTETSNQSKGGTVGCPINGINMARPIY